MAATLRQKCSRLLAVEIFGAEITVDDRSYELYNVMNSTFMYTASNCSTTSSTVYPPTDKNLDTTVDNKRTRSLVVMRAPKNTLICFQLGAGGRPCRANNIMALSHSRHRNTALGDGRRNTVDQHCRRERPWPAPLVMGPGAPGHVKHFRCPETGAHPCTADVRARSNDCCLLWRLEPVAASGGRLRLTRAAIGAAHDFCYPSTDLYRSSRASHRQIFRCLLSLFLGELRSGPARLL